MATNFPNSPSNGDTHAGFTYNSTTGAWKSSGTAPTNISVSDSAPSSPISGQLWWNSTTNKLYIYYTDANSSQWIQASTPGSIGATGPAGPATAGVVSHLDTWRLSSNVTSDASPITTWSHTATSSDFQANLGSAMAVSSGYWTFPTTGYWRVEFIARIDLNANDNLNIGIIGYLYSGGSLSSSTTLAGQTTGDNVGMIHTGYVFTHVNVTNTSNIKVGFYASSIASGNYVQASSSSVDYSYVTFTRLADAV